MNLKKYLRPLLVLVIVFIAINVNHFSIRFTPSEICMTIEFIDDIPDYCAQGLTSHIRPWENAIVNELGEDFEKRIARKRDNAVFFVDGMLVLLGILAVTGPRVKKV